jgi:hypothetical protein
MMFFLVASGSPAAVASVAPRLVDALAASALIDAKPVVHLSPSRAWAVAEMSVADAVVAGGRLLIDGDDLLVTNGTPFAVDGNQSDITQNALRAYRARGSVGVADVLTGSFNFVGVSRDQGACAAVDSSGLYPLYWRADGEIVLFSNRSLALSHVATQAGWDESAFGWVLSHVNVVGEYVPARGVRYVAPGHQARAAWATSGVRVERSPFWLWPSQDDGRENLTDREWDGVTEDLIEHTRLIGEVDAPLSLGLTGGKDSRLCLALARAAGLSERCTAYNSGGPELEHARHVAETAGFTFRKARTGVDRETGSVAPTPRPTPVELPTEQRTRQGGGNFATTSRAMKGSSVRGARYRTRRRPPSKSRAGAASCSAAAMTSTSVNTIQATSTT